MRTPRTIEPREARLQRKSRETQLKEAAAKSSDDAIDRIIRRNIAEFGP